MLLTDRAIVCRDAVAVVRVSAVLHLVDQVAHKCSMILRSAKNESLLALINLAQEFPNAAKLARFDDDACVKVSFAERLAICDFSGEKLVAAVIDVFIDGARHLAHFEWRQEAVFDPVAQSVGVNGFAEISVRIGVVFALGRSRQAKLRGRLEVFQ